MKAVMFITLLDSSYEFYYPYHGFKATVLEVQTDIWSGPRQDFAVLAPLPQEYKGRWKVKDCDLVVLGLCGDYAKGFLSISFHSSKVTISVTAGSVQTPLNWMRVNAIFLISALKNLLFRNFTSPSKLRT